MVKNRKVASSSMAVAPDSMSAFRNPGTVDQVRRRPVSYRILLLFSGIVLYLPLWIRSHWKPYLHFTLTHLPHDDSSKLSDTKSRLDFFKAGMRNGHAGTRHQSSIEDRLSYLESKLNAYLAFSSDPFLSMKLPAKCNNQRGIQDIGCSDKSVPCEMDNHEICLDDFDNMATSGTAPCIVYDFGIRKSPKFGLAFSGPPYNCEVIGFDPSPISEKWWKDKGADIMKKYPTYKFLPVGAGSHDGTTKLLEYDWGQVSFQEFPSKIVDVNNCTNGVCQHIKVPPQKELYVPVKTLPTLVKELGHSDRRISLLKLDVAGSEYALLGHLIENDPALCRRVDQITLEWHHYDYDLHYGVDSNPQLNVIVKLLDVRCGLQQFWIHSKAWPSNSKLYQEFGMTLYYNLASFKRTRWWDEDGNEVPAPPASVTK